MAVGVRLCEIERREIVCSDAIAPQWLDFRSPVAQFNKSTTDTRDTMHKPDGHMGQGRERERWGQLKNHMLSGFFFFFSPLHKTEPNWISHTPSHPHAPFSTAHPNALFLHKKELFLLQRTKRLEAVFPLGGEPGTQDRFRQQQEVLLWLRGRRGGFKGTLQVSRRLSNATLDLLSWR